MKAKKYLILTVVASVLCGTFYRTVMVRAKGESKGSEAYTRTKRSTLRGLQRVQVLVVGPTTEIQKYGLTTTQIRRDVELRLRNAGIKTVSLADPLTAPDLALFRIWASVDKHPSTDLFLVNVHAELDQLVLLQRDSSTSCTATTWETPAKAGLMGRKDLQDVRREVKNHVDRFITDYLIVNQSNLQKYKKHRRGETKLVSSEKVFLPPRVEWSGEKQKLLFSF